MKQFYIYNNSGGIDQVKTRYISKPQQALYNNLFEIFELYSMYKNLKLKYYAYDRRIERHVFILVADHSKLKEQFLSYVIHN